MLLGIIIGILIGALVVMFVFWNKNAEEDGRGVRNFFYWIWKKIQPAFCPHADCKLVYADAHSAVFRCESCGKEFTMRCDEKDNMAEMLLQYGYEFYYPNAFSNTQNKLYIENTKPPFLY